MNVKDHIYIYRNHSTSLLIVIYKEARVITPTQINAFMDYLEELVEDKEFYIIIDLSNAKPPNAECRATLRERFSEVHNRVRAYHFHVGNNFLLKISIKFVGASLGVYEYKTHRSIESAVRAIEEEEVLV